MGGFKSFFKGANIAKRALGFGEDPIEENEAKIKQESKIIEEKLEEDKDEIKKNQARQKYENA